MPGLEVFDLGDPYVGTKHNVLEILDDFEIAQSFENDDIEQAVVDNSVFEERERSSVESPVSDEDERAFVNGGVLRFYKEARRPARCDLRGGNKIAERTEVSLKGGARLFDDLSVETDTTELNKILSVGIGKIDKASLATLDDIPAELQIVCRQAKFHRENIYGPHWQQTKRCVGPRQTVDHFIDSSVAAGRDDFFEALGRGITGKRFRFTRLRCRAQDRTMCD